MPKNKRPVPRKPSAPAAEDDEVRAQALADLALEIAEQEEADPVALRAREEALRHLLRNALRKKDDEVLYGAIEIARYADVDAYQLLRSEIEEAAATVLLRREGAPAMEINAFMVPLIVHSRGGLQEAASFQDGEAFDALVASFQQAGLESAHAKVVLISHAYDVDEIDSISYANLTAMLRDAAASMTERKLTASPALERSITGWRPTGLGPDDETMQLRFLLGFALKRADDPFYLPPAGDEAVDAFFAERMERFRRWTAAAAPLVARCLAVAAPDVHFLYQDLFFGAKQQGMDELAMLRLMSDVRAALVEHGVAPAAVRATVGPAAVDEALMLRVTLGIAGDATLASFDKPLDVAADLEAEIADLRDALGTLGVTDVLLKD